MNPRSQREDRTSGGRQKRHSIIAPVESADLAMGSGDYIAGRLPSRTYLSRSFPARWGRDIGEPSRFVYKVFDKNIVAGAQDWAWTEELAIDMGSRKQIQLHVAREAGAVRELQLQEVIDGSSSAKKLLELDRDQSTRLIDTLKALDGISIDGGTTEWIDDQELRAVLADPTALTRIYGENPEVFRELIESDVDASDVVALQRHREVVEQMRAWLEDPDAFEEASQEAGGPEKAWQQLLENNPWILGIGLGGQLFASWSDKHLEQTIIGHGIDTVGKRPDAVLRTNGIIRSMAFAEIKHHHTRLLAKSEYRSGCWAPSSALAGAVVQSQQTADLAVRKLESFLPDETDEGETLTSGTYIARPRSFVIAGTLEQFHGEHGGDIREQFRSFELFRRNLNEPEILTFDELLARAEWHVHTAAQRARAGHGDNADDDDSSPPSTDPWTDDPWNSAEPAWDRPQDDEPPF